MTPKEIARLITEDPDIFAESWGVPDWDQLERDLMELIAPSDKVTFFRDKVSSPKNVTEQKPDSKPDGWWFTSGNAWVKLIYEKGQEKDIELGRYLYRLDYDPQRVFIIDSLEAYREFTNEYYLKKWFVDWPRVAESYGGIEVAVWLPEFASSHWLQGWDVESGCIWDNSVLTEFDLLMDLQAETREYQAGFDWIEQHDL